MDDTDGLSALDLPHCVQGERSICLPCCLWMVMRFWDATSPGLATLITDCGTILAGDKTGTPGFSPVPVSLRNNYRCTVASLAQSRPLVLDLIRDEYGLDSTHFEAPEGYPDGFPDGSTAVAWLQSIVGRRRLPVIIYLGRPDFIRESKDSQHAVVVTQVRNEFVQCRDAFFFALDGQPPDMYREEFIKEWSKRSCLGYLLQRESCFVRRRRGAAARQLREPQWTHR